MPDESTARFRGFSAKLSRADEHLRSLNEGLERFGEPDPYRVVLEPHGNTREYVARAFIEKPVPSVEWALLFGDCLYNLRSALDHLAWELSGPDPPDKTEFPIFHDPEAFEDEGQGGGLFKIRGINDTQARALIKDAQPCYRNRPKLAALWGLQELSNRDKHRFLTLGTSVIDGATFWEGGSGEAFIDGLRFGPFESGAEISRFRLGAEEPEPQVGMDLKVTFGIALTDAGPGQGMPLAGFLNRIREAIRTDIEQPVARLP